MTLSRPAPVVGRGGLRVSCGPMAAPIIARFLGVMGGEAGLPVDRLHDAAEIGVAIAEACAALGAQPEISIQILVSDAGLLFRVGPVAGGAVALLRADLDLTIERLATSIDIRGRAGGDYLRIRVDSR